jgi:Ca2+-binding EF-hand superfamily protein
MKKSFKVVMTMAVVGLMSLNANAQDKCGGGKCGSAEEMKGMKMEMPKFSDIDANNDGKISEKECTDFRAARKKKLEESGKMAEMKKMMGDMKPPAFSDMDASGDGFLTETEFNDFHKKHMAEMKSKMKEGKGEMKCGSGKCGGK